MKIASPFKHRDQSSKVKVLQITCGKAKSGSIGLGEAKELHLWQLDNSSDILPAKYL